ncbi:MAG: chorismate synthase, partial [Bacteroidota bacterium]
MNNFGKNLRVTIFGKSHSDHMGCVIDGCFAGINFSKADLEAFLERRKPHMPGTTPRTEDDKPKIISGIYKGKTDGTPLAILFKNKNIKSGDYDAFRDLPRPGHADFAANIKFAGYNDPRGGGMFSGRLTLPLTAAGFVAMKHLPGIQIKAELKEAGGSKDISLAVDDAIRE